MVSYIKLFFGGGGPVGEVEEVLPPQILWKVFTVMGLLQKREYNMETYSMLMLTAILPNRAGVKIGTSWDFLYLKNYIEEKANNISD